MAFSTPLTPPSAAPRRSFTLPVTKSASPESQVEVLYNLPSARIITFTTGNPTSRPSSSNGSQVAEEAPGTLSWSTKLERTIAIGPLRIYRAPGSVAFLNCSNALKPILPKSQCWEVDESGKFVLQIRPPQYWRIEVPNMSRVERIQYEELKEVLANVLLFEKTPCPFQRNFSVELPAPSQTPIKKRPWKPVERSMTEMITSSKTKNEQIIATHIFSESIQTTNLEQDLLFLSPSTVHLEDTQAPTNTIATTSPTNSDGGADGLALPSLSKPHNVAKSKLEESRNEQLPSSHTSDEVVSDSQVLIIPSTSQTFSSDTESVRTPEEVTAVLSSDMTIPAKPSALSISHSDIDDSIFKSYHGFEEDSFSDKTDDTCITPRSLLPAFQSMILEPSRSITAPPILSLVTSPPSKRREASPLRSSTSTESGSDLSSSVDSFHSVQSWHSPLAPPSPPASSSSSPTSTYPYPHHNIVLPKRPSTREVSELTVNPETPRAWEIAPIPSLDAHLRSLSPTPKTPTLVNDGSDKSDEEKFGIITPPTIRPNIRHRATTSSNSRRRTLSPLPAAVNLFSPPRRRHRRLQTARHLPTAILQKTCEILLSPPSHLLQLMLNIASKIAAGEWRGVLSGHGESVHWDFEDEYAGEAWFEDDYGISLAKSPSNSKKQSGDSSGGSWEVD